MKITKKPVIIVCAILLALVIIGIVLWFILASEHPIPAEDAKEAYTSAVANINNSSALSYCVSSERQFQFTDQVLTEISTQNISYDPQSCSATESTQIGSYVYNTSEILHDNTLYYTIQSSHFACSKDRTEWIGSKVPAIATDIANYNTITATKHKGVIQICLSDPIRAESWIPYQEYELISASAVITLGSTDYLLESTYTATIQLEQMQIFLVVNVKVDSSATPPLDAPADTENYVYTEHTDALLALEYACGYLLDAKSVTSEYTDFIQCEAFGDQRQQRITVNAVDNGSWSSSIQRTITLSNTGITDSQSVLTKTDLFFNGEATTRTDGSDPVIDPDTDESAAKTAAQDILVGTIMLPQHIASINITQTDNTLTYHFTGNEAFAQLLASEASVTLYRDGVFLTTLSQSYRTEHISAYLTVDKLTGIPVDSGFSYTGIYTIDHVSYPLTFQATQSYTFAKTAMENIEKEAGTSLK